MKDFLEYKDYLGSVHFNADDEIFYGKIECIDDLISFEGNTVNNLKTAFSEAASKTFDAITRLDAIDAAEGTKKNEQKNTKSERREIKISFR